MAILQAISSCVIDIKNDDSPKHWATAGYDWMLG